MMDRIGRSLGIVGSVVVLTACPKVTPTADLQRAYEVAAQRAALAEDSVRGLEDRLSSLEEWVRSGSGVGDDVATEVASTRGVVEELSFQLDGLAQDFESYQMAQEGRILWAEQRLSSLESLLAQEPPPPPCVGPPETCPPPSTAQASSSTSSPRVGEGGSAEERGDEATEEARVRVARERMSAGQQAAARAILEGLLQTSPEGVDLAEVRYLIGQTWLDEGNHRKAARAFREVTDRHASSRWAPWALLRSGEAFEGMGHADDARVFYQSVLQSYPSSDAAPEAKRKLKR